MESSDTKFAEEVRKLNESFQQLKSDLAITKNINNQLHICFVNMEWQCVEIEKNVRRLWAYQLQSRIKSSKKSFAKLKLMIGILNPAIVSVAKVV